MFCIISKRSILSPNPIDELSHQLAEEVWSQQHCFLPLISPPRNRAGGRLLFFPRVTERRRQVGFIHVNCPGHGALSHLIPPSLRPEAETKGEKYHASKASITRCSARKLPEKEASAPPHSRARQIGPGVQSPPTDSHRQKQPGPVQVTMQKLSLWPKGQLWWTEPQRQPVPSGGSSHSQSANRNDSS